MGFVEFDDQGKPYNRDQITTLFDRIAGICENLNRYVTGRTASSSESGELPYREGGEAGHFPHRGMTKNGTKTGPVGGRFFPFEVEHNREPPRAYSFL